MSGSGEKLTGRDAIKSIAAAGLILTISPGRSGTKLLMRLMADCLDINAEHEAAPRLNYVLRTILHVPIAARWWLSAEKLPAIASRLDGRPYADISHLYCKGFIEPLLEIGLKPDFIILRRPAREVALSMLAIGCIPERSLQGKLVLVGPSDPGVVGPNCWNDWNDYQLCYWYALEIERRQKLYARHLPKTGCRTIETTMSELTSLSTFGKLSRFLKEEEDFRVDPDKFYAVVGVNQNPKSDLVKDKFYNEPADIDAREGEVIAALDLTSSNTQNPENFEFLT